MALKLTGHNSEKESDSTSKKSKLKFSLDKKFILVIILTIIVTLTVRFIWGDPTCDYRILSETDNTCEVASWDKDDINAVVPEEVFITFKKYKVVKIGDYAFSQHYNLETIKLPNTITEIGSDAFSWCGMLKEIEIPSTVKKIGCSAFDCCGNLVKVNIPDGITTLERSVFENCDRLRDISIPSSVTEIEKFSFTSCDSLKEIDIPNSVKTIGFGAFSNCKKLTKINIPASVEKIEQQSLSSEINVDPDNANYTSLDGVLYDKDKTILYFCPEAKKEIDIPQSVKKIEDHAFDGCQFLNSIDLPDSLTYIGCYAFSSCMIKKLHIPSKVSDFKTPGCGCPKLVSFEVDERNETYSSVNGILYNKDRTELIRCPLNHKDYVSEMRQESKDKLKHWVETEEESSFSIPNTVVTIAESAFENCRCFSKIEIPNSVETIGSNAFSGSGCHEFYLPKSVKNCVGAFDKICPLKVTITNPETKFHIYKDFLSGEDAQITVVIPKNMELGKYAVPKYAKVIKQ